MINQKARALFVFLIFLSRKFVWMKVKYIVGNKKLPQPTMLNKIVWAGGEEEEEEDTYTEELRSQGKPSLGSLSTACFLSSLIFL